MPYEQLSEQQQAVHDWKAAQSEQANATAEYRRAQAAGEPAKVAIAKQRVDGANNARSIAERRLLLSEQREERMDFGTRNGVPLEGALISDENKPVGSAFQANVRPTGTQRVRGDLATSAQHQLEDMRDIVKKHPEYFGPGAGRKQEFVNWIGSQDKDAQRFRTARTILGDHEAGTFGGRSDQTVRNLEAAAGVFKDNPDAILGGLEQLEKANTVFKKAGTPNTVGSDRAKNTEHVEEYVRDANGKLVKK